MASCVLLNFAGSPLSRSSAIPPIVISLACLEFFIQRIWAQVGGPPVLCSSLSAWPSPVVPQGQCVTLQCHSHCRFGMFRLYKVTGALIPELHSIMLQESFLAGPVTPAHAGTYRCRGSYLGSSSVWSPPSDPLLIVVTGVYRKPSLSAQPGPLVKSEGNMTLHCRSEIQFGSFVLHSEELSKAPWHLPGQPHREGSHANFIMGPVTAAHAGTYRCFGFLNHSFYEWSTPSDLLDIMITGLHKKLSLWAQLGAVLSSGENMTLSCCSESNFDVYHLPRDGQLRGHQLAEGQRHDGASWAHFLLGPAKPALGGTYICHGSFDSSPCEWSGPSDPLYLSVTGNLSSSCLPYRERNSKTGNPRHLHVLAGPLVAIVFLTILLFFLTHRWCHATKNAAIMNREPEVDRMVSREDPPAEDAQEVTYTESGHCIFTQQKTTPTSQGPKEHSSDASVYMEFVRPIKA
ncbi:LOW QUALITY PROTEIN: killer cell immunoglobulin-like receptor 3DL3 [Felis catus]|uniref:LOW QUALITY PROTEIN: killer cell immunoglobulin-like receptor 3DL3 n=1 Tax=Felis catus TaxID=9685 RepID=UPI001D1A15C4|nr:LOW QUALITY PROTEIN: killer cell immunoglobulin-like receptor 3DL3 [Felis catus]